MGVAAVRFLALGGQATRPASELRPAGSAGVFYSGRQAASHLESLRPEPEPAPAPGARSGSGAWDSGRGPGATILRSRPRPPTAELLFVPVPVCFAKNIYIFCFYNTHVCVDQYLRVLLLVSLVNPSGCACPQAYKWRLSFVPLPPLAGTR